MKLANNLMHDRAIHELMHPNSRNNRPQSAHPTLRTVGEEGTGNIDLFAGLRLNDLTSVKEDEKKAEKAPRTRVVASWELRDTEDPLRPQLEFHGHKANKWTRNRLQSATVRELMLSPLSPLPLLTLLLVPLLLRPLRDRNSVPGTEKETDNIRFCYILHD